MFGRRFTATPMGLALLAAVSLAGSSFAGYGLRSDSSNLFPPWWNALFGIVLLTLGSALLVAAFITAWRRRDRAAAWVAFLALALAGAIAGVVQKEPENFYATTAGIFAALILAIAAQARPSTDT